jgi:simple sugar transport system permease protein
VADELVEEGIVPPPARSRLERLGALSWAGPILTTFVAFGVSGAAVLAVGKDPLKVYKAIFDGSGLAFLFQFGHHSIHIPFTQTHVWFWWNTSSVPAQNLQQTLLLATPIVCTALALAFAFRCGLFNIGGQGQYLVGSYFAVWIGSSFIHLDPFLHVVFCLVAGAVCGGLYAGIAGLLKATVGAHEVITTIMLNWTAVWVGSYLFSLGGPLQDSAQSIPVSHAIADGARLPVFWGLRLLQGLSAGVFVALALLVVYWLVVNRTTLGFELRAVGFNPEAARFAGIPVARSYFLAMAISGMFAGLGGALDVTGWEFQLGQLDVSANQIGFIGLAAALLGRSTAVGVGAAALLFGALINGTSGRQLDPSVFDPQLAGALTTIIQGLVILFVGLNLPLLLSSARRRWRAS